MAARDAALRRPPPLDFSRRAKILAIAARDTALRRPPPLGVPTGKLLRVSSSSSPLLFSNQQVALYVDVEDLFSGVPIAAEGAVWWLLASILLDLLGTRPRRYSSVHQLHIIVVDNTWCCGTVQQQEFVRVDATFFFFVVVKGLRRRSAREIAGTTMKTFWRSVSRDLARESAA